ncbi:MAG: TIGR02281 family clan AA aspartic protease [Pseudomonadota bacterium]
MTGDNIATLLFLLLLLTVIGGGFFMANRPSLGQTARQLGTWALVFLGLIVAYGLWDDVQGEFTPAAQAVVTEETISVPRSADGHFYLTLDVNGAPVEFVVDTGATDIVLSEADARRAGIAVEDLAFLGRAMTANGPVEIARVNLQSVQLGEFTDRNVRASVNGGDLGISLLGMSYLSRFETLQIQNNRLTLSR